MRKRNKEPTEPKADSGQPAIEEEDSSESEEEHHEGVDVSVEVDLVMVGFY